jgi:hypothetical protein
MTGKKNLSKWIIIWLNRKLERIWEILKEHFVEEKPWFWIQIVGEDTFMCFLQNRMGVFINRGSGSDPDYVDDVNTDFTIKEE